MKLFKCNIFLRRCNDATGRHILIIVIISYLLITLANLIVTKTIVIAIVVPFDEAAFLALIFTMHLSPC